MSYIQHHFGAVSALTLQHLELSASALAIALVIALPLGIAVARRPALSTPVIGVLSVVYTIPSLALLALLVRWFGLQPLTPIIALVAYAQMILVRNIAAGLRSVDPATSDAARGLGMSGAQRLWRVELPQAFPVVLGGIRIAAVTIIATATLAAWVNAGGLGVLILGGLREDYPQKAVAGSIAAAALAIGADLIFRALERRARRRSGQEPATISPAG